MSNKPLFPPQTIFPQKSEPYSFALFAPKHGRDVATFVSSFTAHLSNQLQLKHTVDIFYLSDQQSLTEKLETGIYDVMVTLDEECTQKAKNIVAQIAPNMPLIFSCIDDSHTQTHPLVNRITGISTPLGEYATQMALVLSYTPEINKILIIQDQTDSNMQLVGTSLLPLLYSNGYHVDMQTYQPILKRHEIMTLADHDMVILLSRDADEQYIQRLSVLCKEHKTVLYITNPSSVAHGAAFGFGKDDISMGGQAALVAHQIITANIMPDVTAVPYRLKINLQALDEQGLRLIKLAPLLSLVNTAQVVYPSTQDKVGAYLRLEQIPLE